MITTRSSISHLKARFYNAALLLFHKAARSCLLASELPSNA